MSDEQDHLGGHGSAPAGAAPPAGAFAEPEAGTLRFEAAVEDAGARLDAFLAARIGGLIRSTLKRVIDEGEVLVEGREAKP